MIISLISTAVCEIYIIFKNNNSKSLFAPTGRKYYDYKLSKARGKFGYEVLALKLWCCHGQLTSFPLVTISTAIGRLLRCLQFRALCCQ